MLRPFKVVPLCIIILFIAGSAMANQLVDQVIVKDAQSSQSLLTYSLWDTGHAEISGNWIDSFQANFLKEVDALTDTQIMRANGPDNHVDPVIARHDLRRFVADDMRQYIAGVLGELPTDARHAVIQRLPGLSAPTSIAFLYRTHTPLSIGRIAAADIMPIAGRKILEIDRLAGSADYTEWRHDLSHEMTHYLIEGDGTFKTYADLAYVIEGETESLTTRTFSKLGWSYPHGIYASPVLLIHRLLEAGCEGSLSAYYVDQETWNYERLIGALANDLATRWKLDPTYAHGFAGMWVGRWRVASDGLLIQIKLNKPIFNPGLTKEDVTEVKDALKAYEPDAQIVQDLGSAGISLPATTTTLP